MLDYIKFHMKNTVLHFKEHLLSNYLARLLGNFNILYIQTLYFNYLKYIYLKVTDHFFKKEDEVILHWFVEYF